MKRSFICVISAFAMLAVAGAAIGGEKAESIALPGGKGGIGFDDIGFSRALNRVLVPGGRTGTLYLIDPRSQKLEAIEGFTAESHYRGGHGEGITSADVGPGVIYVTDRTSRALDVVNQCTRKIVSRTALSAGPDYVRYVQLTNEVWVTEPRAHGIEVFSLGENRAPAHSGFIAVENGPESLVIDNNAGRAYTNEWTDKTLAIDLKLHKIVARWPNQCHSSRGIALDPARSMLLIGCEEGKVSVLDSQGGVLGQSGSVAGVDIIAYNPALHHVYLPGAESASMNVIDVSDPRAPRISGTFPTAHGSHCAAADEQGDVYVCDPQRGRLLVFHDTVHP